MPVMNAAFDPDFGEAWTAQQCAGILCLPDTILLVARRGETVVGFALARSVFEESELLLIATHPSQRGLGVGRQLIEALFNWAKPKGVKAVFLEVRDGNPALDLYLRTGFLQVGRRPDYYKGVYNNQFDALSLRAIIE